MVVEKVVMGEGKSEVLQMGIKMEEGNKDFAVVYVSPKTNALKKEEHKEILSDTMKCIKKILKESDNIYYRDE